MKRYEIKCCVDTKYTDMYSMAEIAASAMIDQLIWLDIPGGEKYIDIIDHEFKIFKHIVGLDSRDIALTSWRDINTLGLYNF